MYITIEGIDTAGKSTQTEALSKKFPNAIITKEPGGTDIGNDIRNIVLNAKAKSKKAEFLLFLADRAEHMQEIIMPNIDEKMIISDRSLVSGIAYALVQSEISETAIVHLNRFATGGVYPQKVFLLHLTKEELQYRLSQKKLDGIELRGSEYLLNIQESIIKATKLLDLELITIDATLSKEEITQEILRHLQLK
jgi:dTMP kinase